MATLSLADRFARLDDPRDPGGRRHPLAAILNLLTAAILCGRRGLGATAQSGRSPTPSQARELGFGHPKTPCKATLSNLLRRLDLGPVEAELRAWAADRTGRPAQMALDGKTPRGSRDDDVPAIHLPAAYAVGAGTTLAQAPVGERTNEHKAALTLLTELPRAGVVITADAMFTHRDFCREVRDGGGDYVLPAKENQPTLRADIRAAFTPQPGLSPPPGPVDRGRPARRLRRRQGARPA
jgi:predicted transposase YbfD/YdcC